MELSAACMRCLIDRQEENIRGKGTPEEQNEYMRSVARIIAESAPQDSAPVLVERINREYAGRFGADTTYEAAKQEYNALMLSLEPQFVSVMEASKDSLHTALVYARAANYIDFGAAGCVEKETLFALLKDAAEERLDERIYRDFLEDLQKAKRLVYVTDNCGEVVCDRIAAEEIKRRFPALKITALVRGQNTLNDATRREAIQAGMERASEIVDNGCGVAGTPLEYISGEARQLLMQADVILAKGQGNFETMHGCGLNIYYSFLCKCEWFQRRFGMERNKGMFVREHYLTDGFAPGMAGSSSCF